MKVCVFVIGGLGVGNGHIYRASNLVAQLSGVCDYTIHVNYISLNDCPLIDELVREKFVGERLRFICQSSLNIRNYQDYDLYVFDVLSIVSDRFLKSLAKRKKRVLLIDYTGECVDGSFLYLNPLYHNKHLLKSAQRIDGSQYPLIQKDFYARTYMFSRQVARICVMQGGTDPHYLIPYLLSGRIFAAFEKLFPHIKFDVFISKSAGKSAEYRSHFAKYHTVNVIDNVNNLAAHLHCYDLAVSSAGLSIYELCASNVPTMIVTGEAKERETARLFHGNGNARYVGDTRWCLKAKFFWTLFKMVLFSRQRRQLYLRNKRVFKYNPIHTILRGA